MDRVTMILSGSSEAKAVLVLKRNEKSVLKFYNFKNQFKNLALAIKQKDRVQKIPLDVESDESKFEVPRDTDFLENMTCAVVDVSNAFCPEIILCGSGASKAEKQKIESQFVPCKPENVAELYTDDDDLDKIIDKNLEQDSKTTYFDSCAKCKYREAFYGEENVQSASQTQLEQKATTASFYKAINVQLEALMKTGEADETLQNIFPNSKFTRIKLDGTDNFYVIGKFVDEEENVKLLCYGVPANSPNNPPQDWKEYATFIPENLDEPQGRGYFLVGQDVETGKTVMLDVK